MRTIYLYTILAFFSFCFTYAQTSTCANAANVVGFTYDNRSYEVVKELKNWGDAANCAKDRGGKLVEINDSAEQTALYNQIKTLTGSGSPTDVGGASHVWIGANDKTTEGIWI